MGLFLKASELILTSALPSREALLAEMGVAMREDGGTLGVFSPKKVGAGLWSWANVDKAALPLTPGGKCSRVRFWPRQGSVLLRLSIVWWDMLVVG